MPIPPFQGNHPGVPKLNRLVDADHAGVLRGDGQYAGVNSGPAGTTVQVNTAQVAAAMPKRSSRHAIVKITALSAGAGMYLGTIYDGVSTATSSADLTMPAGLIAMCDVSVENAAESGGSGHALAVGAWVTGLLVGGLDGGKPIVVVGMNAGSGSGGSSTCPLSPVLTVHTTGGSFDGFTLSWTFPALWSNPKAIDLDYSLDYGTTWTSLLSNYSAATSYNDIGRMPGVLYRTKAHCATCYCDYLPTCGVAIGITPIGPGSIAVDLSAIPLASGVSPLTLTASYGGYSGTIPSGLPGGAGIITIAYGATYAPADHYPCQWGMVITDPFGASYWHGGGKSDPADPTGTYNGSVLSTNLGHATVS